MSVSVLNTTSNLSAKTLVTAEGADTVTGLKTFDRDPSAPFGVSVGSNKVDNLDADKVDGCDALNWTAFTPTLTNWTLGNGTLLGRYAKLGNVIFFKVDIIWGSSTSGSGGLTITFPVTATTSTSHRVAHGEAIDASASQSFDVRARLVTSSTFTLFTGDGASSNQVAATSPMSWATSDELHIVGMYEAA